MSFFIQILETSPRNTNHVHTYHLPETGSLMFHVLNDFRLQIGPAREGEEDRLVVSPYEADR